MRASQTMSLMASLIVATLPMALACGYQNSAPQYKCDVCNNQYGFGSGPVACGAFNATFDDVAAGPLSAHNSAVGLDRYQSTNWNNIDVINTTAIAKPSGAHIAPYSPPNYARVAAGQTGLLTYPTATHSTFGDVSGGAIYGLHYACTLPGQASPNSCHVNVTQLCQANGNSTNIYSTTILDYTYTTTSSNTSMASAAAFDKLIYPRGAGSFNGACYNTTLQAISTKGRPVDLYVDEVILLIIQQQHA